MSIKRIKIVDNGQIKSLKVKKQVIESMNKYGFIECDNLPDLVIAIGGDGTFISALKKTNFNTECLYVGIHTGHLGFLPEVDAKEVEMLFEVILRRSYKEETLSIEKIEVINEAGSLEYHALNEMTLIERGHKTIKFEVQINNKHFEKFAGDGVTISTPTGSTAYNLSLGGSIIFPSLKTLQILPLAPLPMSKHFACLRNSVVVPEDITISLIPEPSYVNKIRIILDGQVIKVPYVKRINITTAKKGINVLRFNNYDFGTRVNEKFLSFKD